MVGRCVTLVLLVFMMLKYGETIQRQFRFDKTHTCEQAYGTVLTASTGVRSKLACATLCADEQVCESCTYNPASQTCKTNNGTWLNPPTSQCTLDVHYLRKQTGAASSGVTDCTGSGACTTPKQNVRLCDGGGTGVCDPTKGRLEVFYNNTWGTVCGDAWMSDYEYNYYYDDNTTTYHNAQVACNMLGFTFTGSLSYQSSFFGEGVDPIWLDEIMCDGNETSIFDCPKDPWGSHDCEHYEDVGVTCE